MDEVKNYLDSNRLLKVYPGKRKKKLYVLYYLASKIESNKEYSEKEINELLNKMHTFNDAATLRRELYDFKLLDRDINGTKYIKPNNIMSLEELIKRYGS